MEETGEPAKKKSPNKEPKTRLIVKHLPKRVTKEQVKEHFEKFGEVTDCRLVEKDGKFRGFAFLGFKSEDAAKQARKELQGTFFNTAKIAVDYAHEHGSSKIARPWSKYSEGSSAFQRKNPESKDRYQKAKEEREARRKAADSETAALTGPKEILPKKGTKEEFERFVDGMKKPKAAKTLATKKVKATKAGMAEERTHVEFGSDDEDGAEVNDFSNFKEKEGERKDAAFDGRIDDLAYLKSKSAAAFDDLTDDEDAEARAEAAAEKEAEEEANGSSEQDALSAPDQKSLLGVEEVEEVEAAPKPQISDEDEDAHIGEHGRLFVANMPFSAGADELKTVCEKHGPVADVHMMHDEDTKRSKGIAFVTFVFPEHAVKARSALDGHAFQGRRLQVRGAKPKVVKEPTESTDKRPKSYKKQKEEKMRKEAQKADHTWNLLYVSANAATAALADEMKVEKRELLDTLSADGLGVKVALTETHILKQTKSWLMKEGIRVDAFERTGSNMMQATHSKERSKDTLIVKHLPADADAAELRERFARHGTIARFCLAPSKTVCVIQFIDARQASVAFTKCAFKRYKHVPMMIEWAPLDTFDAKGAPSAAEEAELKAREEAEEEEEVAASAVSIFVKNLNFASTDAALAGVFERMQGYRSAVVMRKKAAKGSAADKQNSMGYGFVEFKTMEQALNAIKKKQGATLDGKQLQLAISERKQEKKASGDKKTRVGKARLLSAKLAVRNVPFEVQKKELMQLFSTYGKLASVRLPRKPDGTHRGFAFVEFATKSEASTAMESLQHTHLFGRHLVIEPADETETTVEAVREATKRQLERGDGESKKRRKANLLSTGDETKFETML